ncbi:PREDICTED: uncharacterized protein LOC104752841 [Camelina sativa]|uniref:Uncharacterized protein LOC104752841 n=1 Tax=Camelina sativa TaxID=90675 RepID=A0ABM0WMV3_CAMSA|nr:PREDICTED: uncharacterized protein LOC104752841 [Camelina sativa]
MDSIGGFHEVQNDDKLSQLVYYHPKYQPIPKTKKTTLFNKAASRDHPSDQPLFLCPLLRISQDNSDSLTYKVSYSPEYVGSTTRGDKSYDHPLLPLFWSNNKEFDADGGCDICSGSNFGTDYYFCVKCDKVFHKECVQSPFKIKHPYHSDHFLQLSCRFPSDPDMKCLCCRRRATDLVYYCTICDVVMHTVCAMKSIPLGGFHEVENDGKLSQLVYHHPKYHPIPQTRSPTSSSGEAASHDLPFQQRFLCPYPRTLREPSDPPLNYPISYSLEYLGSTISCDDPYEQHSLIPLFWCNNKELDADGGCDICSGSNLGTNYYFCVICDKTFHKECVKSPLQIKHPYHPEHYLRLYYRHPTAASIECFCCGRIAKDLVYYCIICDAVLHTVCAMKSIPFVVDQPKRHDHPLTLFPEQALLTCNICGLIRKNYPTYVCLRCRFVAHNDCMYSPSIIKISRHHHRISYTSSLQSEEWSCGVCRKSIDGDYGAYTCDKCDDYAVHVRCALRKDVWDGVELEGVPEEDDITQDVGPFVIISEGVILHFLHDHYLQLEVSIICDENKFCQVCVMPIFEGNFYSCMECEFILHETCAKSPRRIQHVLHPHPLELIRMSRSKYDKANFLCDACYRYCGDFMYCCPIVECEFGVDVRCVAISEPFDFQGHEHPLFLALHPDVKPICEVCKSECYKQFNCIKCDFIVCIKCATLPYKARYKHDKHFLKLLWGKEVCEKDWCEVCERNLRDTNTKSFYWCNVCCTTLHTACLFDDELYLKPGQILDVYGKEVKQVKVLARRNLSRPLCDSCEYPCQGRLFTIDNITTCSIKCARDII